MAPSQALLCLVVCALSAVSCDPGRDPFECGITKGNAITVCDGYGEVCLCGPNRCAVPDPDKCPASKYRFSRASDGDSADSCVPETEVRPRVSGQTACPVEQTCGDPNVPEDRRKCGGGAVCYCPEGRCIVKDPSCEASGFAYQAANGSCLPAGFTQNALDLGRPGSDGVCIEVSRAQAACGLATTMPCPDGQSCSCQENQCVAFDAASSCPGGWTYPQLGRCVLRPSDASCASGFRFLLGGACAPEAPHTAVPATFLTRGQTTCMAPRKGPAPCGTVAEETCAAGTCACGPSPRCVVEVSRVRCPTGLANADDGACFDGSDRADLAYFQPDKNDNMCEEFKAPRGECGGFQESGAAGGCGPGAFCSCHERRCVTAVSKGVCASGFAFASTGRCVERRSAACPTMFAWASDGACISAPVSTTIQQTLMQAQGRCPTAPPRSCGVRSDAGNVLSCAAGNEICICRGHNRCARISSQPNCPSQLEWADGDNACVPDMTLAQLPVSTPGGDGLCTEGSIPQTECGAAGQSCSSGQCVCRERRCAAAVPKTVCATGAMWTKTQRCVGRPVDAAACNSGFAWESDGSCIGDDLMNAVASELLAPDRMVCPGFDFARDAGATP